LRQAFIAKPLIAECEYGQNASECAPICAYAPIGMLQTRPEKAGDSCVNAPQTAAKKQHLRDLTLCGAVHTAPARRCVF
jgi:hypothetical protein